MQCRYCNKEMYMSFVCGCPESQGKEHLWDSRMRENRRKDE